MTHYEIMALIIAGLAIFISFVSLCTSRKTQKKQLEFEAINAALSKKQLDMLKSNEEIRDKADVSVTLVKVGKVDFRFVINNQSTVEATNVNFKIDENSHDNPLVQDEYRRKIPYPSLQPGQSFTLIAALHMDSDMKYQAVVSWTNPDGSKGSKELTLST